VNIGDILSGQNLGQGAIALRLGLSVIAGGLVGLEREMRRQSAGLRTHILICLGSTLLMLLSIWLPQEFGLDRSDPARIAAQVVSGIGFLGAGAFIKIGNNVRGITTAASIWVVAAIGMAIGAGMWFAALITLALSLIVLGALESAERRFLPAGRTKLLQLWFSEGMGDRAEIEAVLAEFKIGIESIDAYQEAGKKGTRLNLLVMVPINVDIERLFKALRSIGKVGRIVMKENY
jgi:putative Mg2+ transporter-C (MgtC) family protein